MAKKISKTTIKNWQEAEAKLGKIKDLSIDMTRKKVDAETLIQDIRDAKKKHVDRLTKEIKTLQEDLELFCRQNKDDMAPAKSKKMEYGTVGLRNEPKFKWPEKVSTLIERLKQLKLTDYVKVKETPDKQSIMAHHEDLPLEKMGVTRKIVKDVFYIDLNA